MPTSFGTIAANANIEDYSSGGSTAAYTAQTLNPMANFHESTPRAIVGGLNTASVNLLAGKFYGMCFTAFRDCTATEIRMWTASTAQAGATLIKFGLYSVDANDDLTLLKATASDTALLSGTSTEYSKALSSGQALTAGARYCLGVIVVGATTNPAVVGQTCPAAYWYVLRYIPRLQCTSTSSALTDLPSTLATGSMTADGKMPALQVYTAAA